MARLVDKLRSLLPNAGGRVRAFVEHLKPLRCWFVSHSWAAMPYGWAGARIVCSRCGVELWRTQERPGPGAP